MAFTYIILLLIVFMALFIFSVYFILFDNFNPSELPLPYYMVIPFDTHTIFGWYLLWFIQCMMSTSYTVSVLSTTSYFVCSCLYIGTICNHFELLFESLGKNVEQIQERNTKYVELRLQAQTSLHQAVEIHVKIYEWVQIFLCASIKTNLILANW